jgi:AcrR family transcriptional regulator
MPKLVDHEVRRKELLDAVWRIVARAGLAAATTREIAREAGVSNGVLAHYFPDKDELLTAALRSSYKQAYDRMNERTQGLVGLDALRVIVLEALPLDAERLLEAQIGVSFWGMAAGSDVLLQVQRAEWERFWDVLSYRVAEARTLGQLARDARADEVTHELVVLVEGLSLEAVLYPQRVPPARQIAILDAILDRIRAPATADRDRAPAQPSS